MTMLVFGAVAMSMIVGLLVWTLGTESDAERRRLEDHRAAAH